VLKEPRVSAEVRNGVSVFVWKQERGYTAVGLVYDNQNFTPVLRE